ncbi:uncharacterized protein LOC142524343 [Primulina tabacum]|uniref:uncharacterized protein LOC142524343 n=1 Tax=Primulina tabacum TaxID=48773 RepID=UPI003F5A4605
MFMRIEYALPESTKPRIQPYVKLYLRSQEISNSSNPLLSNFTFNPKHGFQSQVFRNNNKRELTVRSSVDSGPPAPSGFPFNALSWVLAIAIAAVVPFINYKWGPLLKNKIETTLKVTEDLAETVKEVAEVVEKVAEDVAEDLPQGGKLREAVDFVENLAERAAKDAGAIDDFIEKVEEEEKTTESFIESLKSVEFENSSTESDEKKLIMVEPITSDELKNPSNARIE